jgi:hypothetical protein
MKRARWHFLVLLVGLVVWAVGAGDFSVRAQGGKLGLSPQDQKKYDELIDSAETTKTIGYILAGVGIALLVAAIPLSIYLDRRRKARKKSLQDAKHPPDHAGPPPAYRPPGQ